jgi:hypothetical protein
MPENGIKVVLNQSRETKGTWFFEASDPNSPITSLYIRKSAFGGKPAPLTITVEVQEV